MNRTFYFFELSHWILFPEAFVIRFLSPLKLIGFTSERGFPDEVAVCGYNIEGLLNTLIIVIVSTGSCLE